MEQHSNIINTHSLHHFVNTHQISLTLFLSLVQPVSEVLFEEGGLCTLMHYGHVCPVWVVLLDDEFLSYKVEARMA